MTAGFCLSFNKIIQNVMNRFQKKFSVNVDNGPRNSSLNFGDVLDSEGTLTFDLILQF